MPVTGLPVCEDEDGAVFHRPALIRWCGVRQALRCRYGVAAGCDHCRPAPVHHRRHYAAGDRSE